MNNRIGPMVKHKSSMCFIKKCLRNWTWTTVVAHLRLLKRAPWTNPNQGRHMERGATINTIYHSIDPSIKWGCRYLFNYAFVHQSGER